MISGLDLNFVPSFLLLGCIKSVCLNKSWKVRQERVNNEFTFTFTAVLYSDYMTDFNCFTSNRIVNQDLIRL